jgi:aminopeptidase N
VLANAERILPFYQAFFGVPFPLPKLDVVVSPGGLQSALEGWGAITFYSESAIFGNQFNGGEHGRRYAVEILAHEMAHQWFGDLVTMHWWRDTFVAEGVAEFSQQVATRTVFPELSTWVDDDDETASLMEHGVAADTLPAIIPITTDLDREDWNAFNTATYDKGAAVIEGWRLIAGARLRDGLGRYLRRFGFGSATFETFWATVGGDAGRAYGRSWLLHPGFPVVDVRATCSAGSTAVRLTQEPFVSDAAIDEAYRVRRWIVPVVLQVGGQERRALFASRRAVIRVPGCGPVAVDPDERPYYLVRYDDATYAGFADGATAGNQRDRNRLYRDATMLHAAGYLRDTPYVRLLAAERDPLSPRVWLSLAQEYRRMDLLVRDAPEARVLAAVQRRALQPFVLRYDRLDSSETAPFRLDYDPAWALGTSGDPIDGATMRDDYDRLLDGAAPKNMATPWLTAMVAASAATSDDVARSETRLRAHPPTVWTMPFEETFLENVADPVLARRVLDDALADDRLTGGNRTTFMFRLGERHPRLVFTYLRDHFRAVVTQLPPTQQAWTICTGVANSLWPAASPRELARFLRSRFPANRGIVRTATARIEQSWKQRNALRRALRTLAAAPG